MADDMDSGLFNIALTDSEDESSNAAAAAAAEAPRDRTGQTEEAFQAVKDSYRPKLDNGEIWKSMSVPLGQRKVDKPEAQELLHAVEELYFYGRYEEAVSFVGRVFEGEGGASGLDRDVRDVLRGYEKKCLVKLEREKSQR